MSQRSMKGFDNRHSRKAWETGDRGTSNRKAGKPLSDPGRPLRCTTNTEALGYWASPMRCGRKEKETWLAFDYIIVDSTVNRPRPMPVILVRLSPRMPPNASESELDPSLYAGRIQAKQVPEIARTPAHLVRARPMNMSKDRAVFPYQSNTMLIQVLRKSPVAGYQGRTESVQVPALEATPTRSNEVKSIAGSGSISVETRFIFPQASRLLYAPTSDAHRLSNGSAFYDSSLWLLRFP